MLQLDGDVGGVWDGGADHTKAASQNPAGGCRGNMIAGVASLSVSFKSLHVFLCESALATMATVQRCSRISYSASQCSSCAGLVTCYVLAQQASRVCSPNGRGAKSLRGLGLLCHLGTGRDI